MKKILILTLLLVSWCSFAYAAAPLIFYSDLTSGPKTGGQNNKGVFVTIWGKNFGATRGSSTVSVGGGAVDNYPTWSDTQVCFQLGANAVTGNITLTTSVGTSNGVPFTIRSGNIYFVDASSPNNPGSGTYTDPWRSPASFYSNKVAGDTCYFRTGTYAGEYGYPGWHANFCFITADSGTAGNEIAYIGYPGETATFSATAGNTPDRLNFRIDTGGSYIVVSKLNLYGDQGCAEPYSYWRFIGNKCNGIHELSATGIVVVSGESSKVYGNEITGGSSGNKLDHAIYVQKSQNADIGWNYIHGNSFDYGPMITNNHDGSNAAGDNWVNIHIHDNLIDMSAYPSRAIGVADVGNSSTFYIYNNIIIGPSIPDAYGNTLYAWYGTLYYYNNTIYNCGNNGAQNYVIYMNAQVTAATFQNNIVYAGATCADYLVVDGGTITNTNNCWYGIGSFATHSSGSCGTNANAVEADPKFVTNGSDFHLQSTSPAKDTGYDTTAIVAKDYDGITRPQGAGVDIGAYEYVSTTPDTTAPATVSNLAASTGASAGEINLTWTAPGDDGSTGTATTYIIKYSSSAITTDAQFNAATQVTGAPAPQVAGTNQSMTVTGLTPGQTYYFAMKTQDEVPNTSTLSNCATAVAKQNHVNNPPVLASIGNKSVNENVLLTFTLSASDADGDSLIYSASNLPQGASFDAATRIFTWIPSYSQAGTYSGVHFAVTDGSASDTEDITITVININRAPVLGTLTNKSVNENAALAFIVNASDPDGDSVTLSVVGSLPSGATFNASSGLFSWTPSYSQSGSYSVTFRASDGTLTDTKTITITVANVNQTPVLTAIGNKTVDKNSTLTFTISATDADGDTLSYSASGLPSGASFNTATRVFSWTPTNSQVGSYSVTFTVTDTSNASASETITVTVEDTDTEPPYVEGMNPDSDEVQVPLDTNITFHIKDSGTGVNKNTIALSIQRETDSAPRNIILNGVSQLSQYPNNVIIQGTASDYTVLYDTPNTNNYQFSYEEKITVIVSADDLAGNKLTNYSYAFTTAMILRGKNLKVSSR